MTAERDRCVGAGQCVLTAAEVFGQDEQEGLVVLLRTEPPARLAADVRLAVSLCPARAITVEG